MTNTRHLIPASEDPDFQALLRHSRRTNWFTLLLDFAALICATVGTIFVFASVATDALKWWWYFVPGLISLALVGFSLLCGRLNEWLLLRKESKRICQELLARVTRQKVGT